MKQILVFAFAFFCVRGFGQQIPSQVQAKRGVFTDSLFLNSRWINGISTNLNSPDSSSNNMLATGSALGPLLTGGFIQNQSSVTQPADLWIKGSVVIGSHNSYKNTLAQGWPSILNVTHGNEQYGLSIQRSSADQGPADLVLYKNAQLFAFGSYLRPLDLGDPIGQISFSGVAGDNTSVKSPVKITGRIEKAAPSYMSSGFVFNTTDAAGNSRQTLLNAQGNLMIGGDPGNPINNYRLNIASGDVLFNSLAGGKGLLGSDSNGVLKKLRLGNGLEIYEGYLYVLTPEYDDQDRGLQKYTAFLQLNDQGELSTYVQQGSTIGNIIWTRDSVGHYTGIATDDSGPFYSPFTWLHTGTTERSENIGATRLYSTGLNTLKLVVKDSNLNYSDDWKEILIDIRIYISG